MVYNQNNSIIREISYLLEGVSNIEDSEIYENEVTPSVESSPKTQQLLTELDTCIRKLSFKEEQSEIPFLSGKRKGSYTSTSSISCELDPSLQVDIVEAKRCSTFHGVLTKLSQRSFPLFNGKNKQSFVLVGSTLLRYKIKNKEYVLSGQYSITSTTTICVTDRFNGEKFAFYISDPTSNFKLNLIADNSQQLSSWLYHIKYIISACKYSIKPLPSLPGSENDFKTFEKPLTKKMLASTINSKRLTEFQNYYQPKLVSPLI